MAFTQLTNNLNIIQALDRFPNTNNGLTYAQLQAKFDEAAGLIKTYLNSTLLAELASTTDSSAGADNIGATAITNLTGTTVQALLESLRNNLKATTDGASGADFVSATAINDLSGTTVQAILESFRDTLKATTDGSSGADFVNATAIAGLSGATVQALLEALDSALTTHKSSADHDGRYYTETELNNGQLDTRYYTETELNNGQLDNRYYTETEVDGFAVKLTGNQTVAGVKTFSSSPIIPAPITDLQASTKKYVDDNIASVVLGQIPDNSLANTKLGTDIKVGSLASLTTTEKGSVVGAINEHDTAIKTTLPNLINATALESSLELAKGLFTLQAQMASGLNSLSQMAIDAFNDETGVGTKTNASYDSMNDLYQPNEGPHAITAVGNASISTTQSKFGGASGYFDGTGDGLTTPDTDDWHFGSGDFTIDFWMYPTAAPTANHCLFGQNISLQCPIQFWFQTDRVLKIYLSFDNVNWLGGTHSFATSALTLNTWTHIAFVRTGNDFKLFVNGTQAGSTVTNSSSFTNYAATLYMFYDKYAGYADEVRISKGIARWTTNFTAPTSAYTADSYTKLLLHMDGTNGTTTFKDDAFISSMTLISNALTCASAPSKGFLSADDIANGATLTYYLSRDNGTTWTTATKDTLVNLSGQPSGTQLKIMLVTSGGTTLPQIRAWAFGYK